jgi:hypothetical protein
MNRYICQFFNLLGTIFKQIIQRIFDLLCARLRNQNPPQPASQQKEPFSFMEATKRAEEQSASEQSENTFTAQDKRAEYQQRNSRRKSKWARWAESRRKQEIAHAEAQANGNSRGVREYWKWIKRHGSSTAKYYARAKARRKAAKKIADKNDQITSAEAKQRKAEIKADAQSELPEDLMIEHLEDHRDGIGWSIAALAKKRFYVRRTLKPNDPNGDMFCEVDDNGHSLLKAVKQLIAEHNHSNQNK